MKLYKYRAVDLDDRASCARVLRIIRDRLVWCARPDTLNDPQEFAWTCDFSATSSTLNILCGLLEKARALPRAEALRRVQAVLQVGNLETLGAAVIEQLIERTRDEIGVACFGSTPDNPVLWSRYANEGTGIAVEFDAPGWLLGSQVHRVVYDDNRRIHVDDFIRSADEYDAAAGVYATLLTKTRYWEPEEEMRFISKRQRVEVALDGSMVSGVFLGPRCTPAVESAIRQLAGDVPVVRMTTDGLTSACSRQRRVR